MENPDKKDDVHGKHIPERGDLRFLKRKVETQWLRILQRWEWSYVQSRWDWYDVHLAKEKENDNV